MQKQTIEYTSPLDALVALAKQLNSYETQYQQSSEDFYAHYQEGLSSDDEDFIEWANTYQHYLALHQDLNLKLNHVA